MNSMLLLNDDWQVLPIVWEGKPVSKKASFYHNDIISNEIHYIYFLISDGKYIYEDVYDYVKKANKLDKTYNHFLKDYKWFTKNDLQKIDPTVSSQNEILRCLDILSNGDIFYDNPYQSHVKVESFNTEHFKVDLNKNIMNVYFNNELVAVYERGLFKYYHGHKDLTRNFNTRNPYEKHELNGDSNQLWTAREVAKLQLCKCIEREISKEKGNAFAFRKWDSYASKRNSPKYMFYARVPKIIKTENNIPVWGYTRFIDKRWYQGVVDKSLEKLSFNDELSLKNYKEMITSITQSTYDRFNNPRYFSKEVKSSIEDYTKNCIKKKINELLGDL